MLVGYKYRSDHFFSHLILGLKRGSSANLRQAFKVLLKEIKRKNPDLEINYFAAWVKDVLDNQERTHVHILWDAPFLERDWLLQQMQIYLQEDCSVYIRAVKPHQHRRAIRYIMQYLNNQGEIADNEKRPEQVQVRYSSSRGWLPAGYTDVWKAMLTDFYQKPNHDARNSEKGVLLSLSQNTDEWRYALWNSIDAWIAEQRDLKVTVKKTFDEYQKSWK